jgi:tRNA pseudouridine13 synthase
MQPKRTFFLTHAPISAHFTQNTKDFVVEEVPLYGPSGDGEHLMITVRKKGLSTWELIRVISEQTGVKTRDVGYAGLKDKQAMTIQSLTLPARFGDRLEKMSHPYIKVLNSARHRNKLKIGHLKGNRFFIRLKKVLPHEALKLSEALERIGSLGMPNFFGYQRFGREGDNYKKAKAMLEGEAKVRGRKMQTFLINALQSERFNAWLSRRLEISHLIGGMKPDQAAKALGREGGLIDQLRAQPHFFKLLPGDLMNHYPHGKLFLAEDLLSEANRFAAKDVSPTGLLSGHRVQMASDLAGVEEQPFFEPIPAPGDRRYGWIFPEIESGRHVPEQAHFELAFTLPKGSYATVLIEELLHRQLEAQPFEESL